MATTAPDSVGRAEPGGTMRASLDALRRLFDLADEHLFDADYFEELSGRFRQLHVQIRTHDAAQYMSADSLSAETVLPELSEEMNRLRGEHFQFLGILDRLIRSAGSMADRPMEDKEVFFLRGRELVAMLRRHEAEEDRLFYLALWRDTGGES